MVDQLRLDLKRAAYFNDTTIGALYLNGIFQCWILEDVVRPDGVKVPGQTAIPAGTYALGLHDSPRFKRVLIHILGVPMFEYILIHPGNKKEDTDGCLLPGNIAGPGPYVSESSKAHEALFKIVAPALEAKIPGFITVSNLPR
jgi:hypothetical protein